MQGELYICCSAGLQRPNGDPELSLSVVSTYDATQERLTPISEKQRMDRPSGAHSAFTRPSRPASMRAIQVSSRSLKTLRNPLLAHAAKTYSESQDQAACVMRQEVSLDVEPDICVGPSAGGRTCHVRVTWKESERRMTSLSCAAERRKCVPGLNATSPADCLYTSVKSMTLRAMDAAGEAARIRVYAVEATDGHHKGLIRASVRPSRISHALIA
jgi:hypothetical protein